MTPKQDRFVEEYLIDLNATQAAIRAGYSVKTATIIGFENLTKPNIQVAIQERQVALAERIGVTQNMVVNELARIGFADMRDYADWGAGGVTLKESTALPVGASAAVAEVSETTTKEGGTVRFKLHDKKGALDSLAKHLGMFIERSEHNVRVQWEFVIGEGYVDDKAAAIEGQSGVID